MYMRIYLFIFFSVVFFFLLGGRERARGRAFGRKSVGVLEKENFLSEGVGKKQKQTPKK